MFLTLSSLELLFSDDKHPFIAYNTTIIDYYNTTIIWVLLVIGAYI